MRGKKAMAQTKDTAHEGILPLAWEKEFFEFILCEFDGYTPTRVGKSLEIFRFQWMK